MATGTRALTLKLIADIDDFNKNLDKGSTEVEGFSGKVEKFGKMAAAAFAAAALACYLLQRYIPARRPDIRRGINFWTIPTVVASALCAFVGTGYYFEVGMRYH